MPRKRLPKRPAPAPEPPTPAVLPPDESVKLELSQEDLRMLNRIASGEPVPGAQTILRAIKLKMEHTVAKPKQEIGIDGGLTVSIKTLTPSDLEHPPEIPE